MLTIVEIPSFPYTVRLLVSFSLILGSRQTHEISGMLEDFFLLFQPLPWTNRDFYHAPQPQSRYSRTVASSSSLLSGIILSVSESRRHTFYHCCHSPIPRSIHAACPALSLVLRSTPVHYHRAYTPTTASLKTSTLFSLQHSLLSRLTTPWCTIKFHEFRVFFSHNTFFSGKVHISRSNIVCHGSTKDDRDGFKKSSTSVQIFEASRNPSSTAYQRSNNSALFPENHIFQIPCLFFSSAVAACFKILISGRCERSSERVAAMQTMQRGNFTSAAVKSLLAPGSYGITQACKYAYKNLNYSPSFLSR